MKVLLISEGQSELAGALRRLVERLVPKSKLEFDNDRVSRQDLHAHHGKGQGYFKRAVRWMLEARKRGYDALILVIDEDGQAKRSEEISQAQQFEKCQIRRALGVAIRTFDAWILADEKSLTKVLEYAVSKQKDPETIVDPKSICREILENSACQVKPVEMYSAVADVVDLKVLGSRCKKGFAPFAKHVRELQ